MLDSIETKAAMPHIVVDEIKVKMGVKDETRILQNITIKVTKNYICMGRSRKVEWSEIDVDTFDCQLDLLKKAMNGNTRSFEYCLKTTNTTFCLGFYDYQNLQKFNQFISQVSNFISKSPRCMDCDMIVTVSEDEGDDKKIMKSYRKKEKSSSTTQNRALVTPWTSTKTIRKRKFSSADTERNWTSTRPLDLSSSLVDISSSPTKENHAVQQKFIGLRNIGNSCYLNAAVQMLFSVGSFISDLESFYTTVRMASSPHVLMPLTENLLDLARRMKNLRSDRAIESSSADPSKLKEAVDKATDKFKGFQQRDAHEFAATFIDLLHDEATAASQGGVVPTDTHFLMKVERCLACDSCGYSR
jgi:hypothetical protein